MTFPKWIQHMNRVQAQVTYKQIQTHFQQQEPAQADPMKISTVIRYDITSLLSLS